MPDLQSCRCVLWGNILSNQDNQDTIFREIEIKIRYLESYDIYDILRNNKRKYNIGWNKKNAAAAVGGEGKDCCSNLVFTKNGTRI